jgi:hypothetical protein
MDAVKYFKLDFTLSKGFLKLYLVIFAFILGMFILLKASALALNMLYFSVMCLSLLPFLADTGGKCQKMYYVFPARIKSMVLGRYLFFYGILGIALIVNAIWMMCDKLGNLEILYLCISALVSSILCFVQIPIFYKFGYEQGQVISNLIYLVPSTLVIMLPTLFKIFEPKAGFMDMVSFATHHVGLMVMAAVVLLAAVGRISYMISCGICRRKEL